MNVWNPNIPLNVKTRKKIVCLCFTVTAFGYVLQEQDSTIRQHLADILEQEDRWQEAATVLSEIPFDNGQK